ncbi:hypothetical protein VNO80_14475 [Phaseolus coccineus]|uniref:Uncharacterized protein n=1 Tax=Phaseolus coccineus TaxID=3886 RepID=A0AAN9MIC3_PHACN
MNDYNVELNSLATVEEMKGNASGTVVCPKPRRVRVFASMSTKSLRWKCFQQGEESNSKARTELLDITSLIQDGDVSSPPFFLGSPPVRVDNPLIKDAQFGYEKHVIQSSSPSASSPGLFSPSSPLRSVRMNFGIKSAAVRVVGFDCHVGTFA